MVSLRQLVVLGLGGAGCYLDMPLGKIESEKPDAAAADSDGGPLDVCLPFEGCLVPIGAPPPSEAFGEPVASDETLHAESWTFTALEADAHGRLYAFWWWVPAIEIGDPSLAVEHLAWRTRAAGETAWSEVRAVPGVTREDFEEARCHPSPADTPLQFAATDDGYVHAFWRKIASCMSGDLSLVEHAIFDQGEIAFREEMPIECSPGRELRMTDALARPDGEVTVAFLCGLEGQLQTFSCGCWTRSTLVGEGDGDDGTDLAVQGDLQLASVGGELWIVVRTLGNDLWARRLDDPAEPESYRLVSDTGTAVGAPVVFSGNEDRLWVAWHEDRIPSETMSVSTLVDDAFAPAVSLPGGSSLIQAIDGVWVPSMGPMLLTEETVATFGEGDEENVVHDYFWVRTFDHEWSAPVLAAESQATFGDEEDLVRHTASDLTVADGLPYLAHVTWLGGTEYALRVVPVETP